MRSIQILFVGSLFAIFVGCVPAGLRAQGSPVFVDSCNVAAKVHLKLLPLPGSFVPGTVEALRSCPALGNSTVKIANASAGKAKSIGMVLQIEGGKLTRTTARSSGEKNFRKLLEQLTKQVGRPTKLVASKGMHTYSWDMNFAAHCKITLTYDGADQASVAIMESSVD